MPMPMPTAPDQTPIALGRSSALKTVEMMASVAGMTMAPPTAITARIEMSSVGGGGEGGREGGKAEDDEPA